MSRWNENNPQNGRDPELQAFFHELSEQASSQEEWQSLDHASQITSSRPDEHRAHARRPARLVFPKTHSKVPSPSSTGQSVSSSNNRKTDIQQIALSLILLALLFSPFILSELRLGTGLSPMRWRAFEQKRREQELERLSKPIVLEKLESVKNPELEKGKNDLLKALLEKRQRELSGLPVEKFRNEPWNPALEQWQREIAEKQIENEKLRREKHASQPFSPSQQYKETDPVKAPRPEWDEREP